MINIKSKSDCCGCFACYGICPNKAIELIEDENGFKYPSVNMNNCVKCGLCLKVCPIAISHNRLNETKAYSVINRDDEYRKNSSSGGIFSLLSLEIIKNKGVVFGAKFNEKYDVVHSFAENIEELKSFMGSKYVQSSINDCYKNARKFLEEGRIVLFSGTPCQIEGLKSFLQKDYSNLYTQDLICHGVPSPKLWRKYLESVIEKGLGKIERINFRNKDNGWKNYNVNIKYTYGEYKNVHKKDSYMQAFLNNICLRESCYECKFKKINRNSDITLADFWGINKINPSFDDDRGTSLVILNSEKGIKLFELIKMNTLCKEVDLNEAIKYNTAMVKSVSKNENREEFFSDLDKLEFNELIKKYII